MGIFSNADNMSAVTLAISTKYRMPKVLYNVACDIPEEIINKQRMGPKLNELKMVDCLLTIRMMLWYY